MIKSKHYTMIRNTTKTALEVFEDWLEDHNQKIVVRGIVRWSDIGESNLVPEYYSLEKISDTKGDKTITSKELDSIAKMGESNFRSMCLDLMKGYTIRHMGGEDSIGDPVNLWECM